MYREVVEVSVSCRKIHTQPDGWWLERRKARNEVEEGGELNDDDGKKKRRTRILSEIAANPDYSHSPGACNTETVTPLLIARAHTDSARIW